MSIEENLAEPRVMRFAELVGAPGDAPLAIDHYQRGFVWSEEKVRQLIDDLRTYWKDSRGTAYYMGTVLLHRDPGEGKRFIIDGQQRFTALCILYWHLHDELPPNTDLAYRSVDSAANIQQALACFRQVGDLAKALFDHLCFTVIEVPTQDLAFAFFDTQNNRGVRLDATDLLKAFHLRAIRAHGQEDEGGKRAALELAGATRWESMQTTARSMRGLPGDFTASLFNLVLWRARRWRGRHIGVESHDALLREFQHAAQPPGTDPAHIPLYPGRCNQLGRALVLQDDGSVAVDARLVALGRGAADLPFSVRQPVSSGIGFFLYAEKYAGLVGELMHEGHYDAEVRAFQNLYSTVIGELSVYLREVFVLGVVMYADRFGFEKLHAFALHFEHLLGSIRLGQSYIQRETARNIFRDGWLNLLDVIAGAFVPDEVIEYLKADPDVDKAYRKYDPDQDGGKTVRGRYRAALLNYYADERKDAVDLGEKRHWMNTRIGAARNH